MTAMRLFQGDIVIFNYPQDDLVTYKRRPAIVVSGPAINRTNAVILSPITSRIRNEWFSFVINDSDLTDPLDGVESEIRCDVFTTTAKELIVRKISSLKPERHSEMLLKIHNSFLQ